jgi:hypothetical protein
MRKIEFLIMGLFRKPSNQKRQTSSRADKSHICVEGLASKI